MMVIREILEERRRKYRIKQCAKKIFISAAVVCLAIFWAVTPRTEAFLRNIKSDQIALVVTDTLYEINASFVLDNSSGTQTLLALTSDMNGLVLSSAAPAQSPDDISGRVFLQEGYDVNNVDMGTIQVYAGDIPLPFKGISIEENTLILLFDSNIESILGHGSHVIQVEGMFNDGWVHFTGQGTLEFIDEELIAEQKAVQMVEELEAETASLFQGKIDSVRSFVEGIREGDVKSNLLSRLDIVQERLDRIIVSMQIQKQLEEAETAVVRAETTSLPEDRETAQNLVDALPDGVEKAALNARLSAIVIETEPEPERQDDPPVDADIPVNTGDGDIAGEPGVGGDTDIPNGTGGSSLGDGSNGGTLDGTGETINESDPVEQDGSGATEGTGSNIDPDIPGSDGAGVNIN